MAKVVADMSMSLDGFVADPSDGIELLFDWHRNGDVVVPTADPQRSFRTSAASAAVLREMLDNIGAVVCGRRLFDIAGGWGGKHPLGVPVLVVTHTVPDGWPRDGAPFTFVTEGVEAAIARAKVVAGNGWVGVGGADIVQQCLNGGLLDEIRVDLVPVLVGRGIRLFDKMAAGPMRLQTTRVIEGNDVTHVHHRVPRA
ncbi:dihydrofolate reductase family protein [Dactylosporangium sp. NPDC049525]|uniref:dihydrofolate reductase family protein n=1 Tax=Dactylosporangium sp. NPDC049525 TaxID=3154730 RepID=UPI003444FDF6